MTKDFLWVRHDQPHTYQRNTMLKTHPELKKLMGPEYKSKYIATILVVSQLFLAIASKEIHGWKYITIVYILGATLTQALFLAIHELSHNLFFRTHSSNRFFAMFCNFPIVFPFAESFRFYHLLHHQHQGVHFVDSDLPSEFEARLFQGTFGKFCWYNCQIIFYALRPCLTLKQPITRYLIINAILQTVFDTIIYIHFGIEPFRFLILSILIAGGLGLHPTSSHFVSEHFLLFEPCENEIQENKIQETFDYRGFLNNFTWNVGMHQCHHNMPNIPWSKLKQVYTIAPEYFENVTVHDSWIMVPFQFIFNKNITLRSRVKRHMKTN